MRAHLRSNEEECSESDSNRVSVQTNSTTENALTENGGGSVKTIFTFLHTVRCRMQYTVGSTSHNVLELTGDVMIVNTVTLGKEQDNVHGRRTTTT